MPGPTPRAKLPYSVAREWARTVPARRVKLSPGRESDFLRIARLGDAWGYELDRLGASYDMLRWIAGASRPEWVAEREKRYRAVVALLRAGGDHYDFLALKDSMPKLGHQATRAARAMRTARPRARRRAARRRG